MISNLSYLNANALTSYPLVNSTILEDFIVDANFIQFDGTIPKLKTIGVFSDRIDLNILFDIGSVVKSIDRVAFIVGSEHRIYRNTRYLGKLVIGDGANKYWDDSINRTITSNSEFIASTVVSINSRGGLYSVNGRSEDLTFVNDDNMYYEVDGQSVKFNAIGKPDTLVANPLKTLNGVVPIDGKVHIKDSELMRVNGISGGVKFSLIGDTKRNSVIVSQS